MLPQSGEDGNSFVPPRSAGNRPIKIDGCQHFGPKSAQVGASYVAQSFAEICCLDVGWTGPAFLSGPFVLSFNKFFSGPVFSTKPNLILF
jgi:hypothetical protein